MNHIDDDLADRARPVHRRAPRLVVPAAALALACAVAAGITLSGHEQETVSGRRDTVTGMQPLRRC
ncbi:hypothetical protein [Streptomyces sp. B1I3]|uniref:hypothetical protein n=1 Tax=Streptomyces sp. B1I3 TaxID=3042264 RepID=UPI002782712E|nr:hypothetical protein [Streptomyces sp. B1I3]MDQ0793424.1 hypothetical protein [Streptomyces sp. B1I3]